MSPLTVWNVLLETAPGWIAGGAIAVGAAVGRLMRHRQPLSKREELAIVLRQTPGVRVADASNGTTVRIDGLVREVAGDDLVVEDDTGCIRVPRRGAGVILQAVRPITVGVRVAAVGMILRQQVGATYRTNELRTSLEACPSLWVTNDPALVAR